MEVDWSATGSMITGVSTAIGAIATFFGGGAVIWAARKAANTFDSWKQQKIAERRFEHAERLLGATYEAREALWSVRAPMVFEHELQAARKNLEAGPGWEANAEDVRQRMTTAQAMIGRLGQFDEQQRELRACLPLAKAFFDEDLEAAISSLLRQFWELRMAIEAFAHDNGRDAEYTVGLRRTLWSTGGPKDETKLTSDIKESIDLIELKCTPALRAG